MQLFQTPDHVVILNEMVHNTRVVPLNGGQHLPSHLRQQVGDSRGRWEGDTLVVETTNFLRETGFTGAGEGLHLIERFTRADADTLVYEFTIEDADRFTPTVDRDDSHAPQPRADVRVCLPRGQLRHDEPARWRPRRGTVGCHRERRLSREGLAARGETPRHSIGGRSRLAALLLGRICPIFSLVAPGDPGLPPLSVPRGGFTTGC